MRLWLDTEFNGFGGALISVALVDENLWAFYHQLHCIDPVPWVQENVIPALDPYPPVSYADVQQSLAAWLGQYDAVHIVADWPDDIAYFCKLLITAPGQRIDTPPITFEIRRDLDATSVRPHNALDDANAMRSAHLALEGQS